MAAGQTEKNGEEKVMDENLFDRKIKELADSAEVMPEAGIWDNIRREMDYRRKRRFTMKILSAAAAAAVLVFGIVSLVMRNESSSPMAPQGSIYVAERISDDTLSVVVPEDTGDGLAVQIVSSGIENAVAEATAAETKKAKVAYETAETVHVPDPSAAESPAVAVQETERETETQVETPLYEDQTSFNTYRTACAADPAPARKRGGFSVSASGILNPSDASGNVDFTSQSFTSGVGGTSSTTGIVPISVPKHSFPVTVGVNVVYSFLNDRLGVGLGVNYTFMKSSYEALVNKASQSLVEQRLHYLGIPFDFYANFISTKSFNLYASVGGMMEKGLSAVYNVSEITSNHYTIEESIDGLQWSVNLGVGFEYRFVEFAGLYLDPRLTYFFDCGQPYSVRAEQPLQFGVQFGVKFHI